MKDTQKLLFKFPGLVFNSLIRKYKVRRIVQDLKIIWHDEKLIAKYVVLPNNSSCEPALVYLDLRSTDYKSVRVMLLKSLPKLKFGEALDSDLDVYSSLEVGELESEPDLNRENKYGSVVNLYLEFRHPELGVINITESKNLLLNLYSSHMMTVVYELYLNDDWIQECFKLPVSPMFIRRKKPYIGKN